MSGADPNQFRSGEEVDADGYRVEERAHTEEYHQTKDVQEEDDRTKIHWKDEKVVKLEEVKSKETIRLATPEEIRALLEADFGGIDEISAGKEITVEERSRKETTHRKTVDGHPVVESSVTEDLKSDEIKEDPVWKKNPPKHSDSESDKDVSFRFSAGPESPREGVVVRADAPIVEVPQVVSIASEAAAEAPPTADSGEIVVADVSIPDLEEISLTSPRSEGAKDAGVSGVSGKGKTGDRHADVEIEVDDKENENSSRRHEIRHKRHVIEEVIIEDSDKFYEKQEKRPRLFVKGTLDRKKEEPMDTSSLSHEAERERSKTLPEKSVHTESLPNINVENVTYVVDHEQSTTGSVDLEVHGKKPLAEHKWYSFPRKHAKLKVTDDAAKKVDRPSKKVQDEIVIFAGNKVENPNRSWGISFGKGQNEAVTEKVTFVVENEPTVSTPAQEAAVRSAGKEKPEAEHGQETSVTYVVEQQLPEIEAKSDEDKKHTLSLKEKLGSLFPEKDNSRITVEEPETVTYTVTTESSKPPQGEDVEEKRRSWNPFAKTEHAESVNLETQTVTYVVEQELPEAKLKASKGGHQQDVPTDESLTIAVQSGKDESVTNDDEEKKKKHWNLKWQTKEKKEKKEKQRRFQEEVVVDDTHLHPDEGAVKLSLPSFGHRLKDSEKPETTDSNIRSEESLTFVVKKELPVVEKSPTEGTKVRSEDSKEIRFVVEEAQGAVETDVDKEKSWNPFGKFISEKSAKERPESETVTFVVEHDLPEADVQLNNDKEHSLSLQAKHSVEPEVVKKPATNTETMTFVVEQEVTEPEIDREKDHSFSLIEKLKGVLPEKKSTYTVNRPESETVTYVVEREVEIPEPEPRLDKEKERSWNLLGKVGSLFPEKTSSKGSLEPETVTFVVEGQQENVTPSRSGKKHKPETDKKDTLKSRRQEEIIVDDAQVFTEGVEEKSTKESSKKRPKAEPTSEEVTFVVTGEALTPAKPEASLKVSVPDSERKVDEVTMETKTFIVNEEIPYPDHKAIELAEKEEKEKDSWKLPHIKLPTLFHKHDGDVDDDTTGAQQETVTFVVKKDVAENEDKQEGSLEKQATPQDDKKTEVKVKPSTVPKTREKAPQREVIVDDTHLFSEKSEGHWVPTFHKPSSKTASLEHPKVTKDKEAESGIETVTYTVTTETTPAELDTSTDFGKGKRYKWRVFNKKHSKTGDISGSKEASLPRESRQEEMVITNMKYDADGDEFTAFYQPEEIKADAEKPLEVIVQPPKAEVTVNSVLDESDDIPTIEVPLEKVELRGQLQAERRDEADEQLTFDLGYLKATEDVREKFISFPEPKRIVIAGAADGFDEGEIVTEDKDTFDDKRFETQFETSTPKRDLSVSTGAHGDATAGKQLDVTSSSEASLSFLPQTGEYDVSIDSRPNSLYAFSTTVTGSGIPAPPSPHFVIIAIDFGTTFSGYAFSFTQDINSICVMKKWQEGDAGVINMKTPTVLLLTPQGKFHSFGFTAKDFYHNLTPKEAKQWLYFEKFKMTLHYNTDLSTTTQLEASNGQSVPALTVFSHALRFFRDHALQEVSDQSQTRILNEDVRWVITVPAIWKAPAKQFMRQAAYQAGIASQDNPDQLLVALEPEAASVFIRKQRLQQLIPESVIAERPVSMIGRDASPEPVLRDRISQVYNKRDTNRWSQAFSSDASSMSFQRAPSPLYTEVKVGEDLDIIGTRYMVADCGGGTVDITVYEMNSDTGNLIELYKATGGPFGSMGVDLAFEELLVDIFGGDFIRVFKEKRPAGWVDLMMAFESRKRAATPIKSKVLNVSLPFSFMDYHKKFRNSTVESAIKKYANKDVRWSSQGMLRLMPEAMDRLFQPTLNEIKDAIANVLNKPEVKGVQYIFLVGGFAESSMVQVEMRKEFSDRVKILIPTDASLAILKGAVLFGNDPAIVKVRKSRMSYGLAVLNKFVRGKHPESKLAYKDGVEWCLDVFDPLVLANQSVALGSCVTRSYTPAGSGQKFGNFDIYCSDSDQVQFVTDPGVTNCGQLRLDLSDLDEGVTGGRRREVQAKMIFGDTEIKVIGIDVATGNSVKASIDFLNK